jgi:hypothetical protein
MTQNTIQINGVEYVRKDTIKPEVAKVEGTPVGQYCIIRCRDAGVWAGVVVKHNGQSVMLAVARRLWSWTAAKGHTLSAVANYGIKDGKLPAPVDEVYLTEACELIPMTKVAEESIISWKAHNE